MIEIIVALGLALLLGIFIGRAFGLNEGKQALFRYMSTASSLYNVLHEVHEKHGIVEEVEAALRKHGMEVRRIRTGE